ncbi:cytochrome c-type biogenesis protein [Roseibium sp. MMSF_3412]|uniref:cytochrome c-type biogenesis protein n=1 Tax=Roseibium sp. MMSF_3412 TaxID=3046712 RepID=UPI00273D2FB6|nr:cytochrome c-type biogenesis protein [Roseibium sp. MMSF_3412]
MRMFLGHLLIGLLSVLAVVSVLSGPALAVDGDEMFADPAREARARDVGRQLRCLVCQNQSIFDSNSGLAKDLRVLVRTRMSEGDSDTEILTYIADRYGDYVLLQPRLSVRNAVLWAAPALALLLGLAIVALYLKSRSPDRTEVRLTEDEREAARKLLQEGRP